MDVLFDSNEQLNGLLTGQSYWTTDELWKMENSAMSDLYDEIVKSDNTGTADTFFEDDRPSEVSLADSIDRSLGGSPCPFHPSPCSSTSIEDTSIMLPDGCCPSTLNNEDQVDLLVKNKEDPNEPADKSQRSKSRGALMARRNRERKKEHISQLESKVCELRSKNEKLVKENKSLKSGVDRLTQELLYLRNIVKNESELSKIIRAVTMVPGIKMSTSPICALSDGGRPEIENIPPVENTDGPPAKRARPDLSGVCLNVQDGLVSLELCTQCNVSSKKAGG